MDEGREGAIPPGVLKPSQQEAIQSLGSQNKKETEQPASGNRNVSRRTFLAGLAGALGMGFLAGRGTAPGSSRSEPVNEPAETFPGEPIKVDGNGQGPDGEDVLPMMQPMMGEDVLAKVNTGTQPEVGPLPVPRDPDAPKPLPMMPKDPDADVVARAETGAGAERNPPLPPNEDEPEPLPKRGPVTDDPVNA